MSDRRPSKGIHAESGILRKAKPQHTADAHLDDLLVFGYACKIFRDNDRASEIDHGKHLIPWMNDHTLKIDRYDVRATLSDIRPHEPPPGGFSDRMASLTPAEQRAEQLCEEERYLSLLNNDVEEEMYKDEELKRLHKQRSSTYGQVAFDYNATQLQPDQKKATNQEQTVEEEPDTPFQSNPRFYVPPDIELPDSMKLHAVIEKTAKFIATQGPQMEILIKAKQSNNLQFEFLNINNRLNRYYKHLLNAVKHGFYPAEEPEIEAPQPQQEINTPVVEEQPPAVVVPQIRYKPSADCSYTQLISKIKGVPIPETNGSGNAGFVAFSGDTNFQHIMEYRNKMIMNAEGHAKNQPASATNSLKPASASAEAFIGRKPTAPLLATPISGRVALPKPNVVRSVPVPATAEVKKISTGLMLAQCYNSETDDEEEDDVDAEATPKIEQPAVGVPVVYDFPVPEPELRNIIDKTAAYVLKNGKEFEEILRTKNDERFAFLKYTDQHYRYYVHKVTGAICSAPLHVKPTNETVENTNGISGKAQKPQPIGEIPSKITTSVSFSIKPKDDVPLKSTVLREASSDEENVSSPPKSPVKPTFSIKPVPTALLPTPSPPITTNPSTVPLASLPTEGFTAISAPDSRPPSPLLQANPVHIEINETTIRDAILDEKPSTNGQSDAIKEAKRAEERVKDRLAQVARDKLGQVTKDKQLQLERRKKAMAFLNQIKPIEKEAEVIIPTIPIPTFEPESIESVPLPESSPILDTPAIIVEETPDAIDPAVESTDSPAQKNDNTREGSVISVHSVDSSPERPVLVVENGGIVSDDDEDEVVFGERRRKRSRKHSRSPSKSSSKRLKSKKSKHRHHHVKKSKSSSRRSRSASRSRSHSVNEKSSSRRRRRSRSRSSNKRSRPVEAYHHKNSSSSSRKHRHRDRDYD